PQEQALRDSLDANTISICVQTEQLAAALDSLNRKPALVVTDSQAIKAVAKIVPENVNLTTYSILFSRLKGELDEFINGLTVLKSLKDNDKIFIAEACTHHSQDDDIGRVKIPKWLTAFTGKKLEFIINPGKMIHKDISESKLIVHCGGCMINRKEVLSRIDKARFSSIPITNYGVLISHIHNALLRTIRMFPSSYKIYKGILNEEK
ncbi:[FeFe] hydrogenase H-cluster maturation GTPase HydF, partial [candidate division WOR-3 bacterium]|nr:[FeFe] hydrogenase H-cluster maturation GTPase HydF [candidate division WOR-3 bacterium]